MAAPRITRAAPSIQASSSSGARQRGGASSPTGTPTWRARRAAADSSGRPATSRVRPRLERHAPRATRHAPRRAAATGVHGNTGLRLVGRLRVGVACVLPRLTPRIHMHAHTHRLCPPRSALPSPVLTLSVTPVLDAPCVRIRSAATAAPPPAAAAALAPLPPAQSSMPWFAGSDSGRAWGGDAASG